MKSGEEAAHFLRLSLSKGWNSYIKTSILKGPRIEKLPRLLGQWEGRTGLYVIQREYLIHADCSIGCKLPQHRVCISVCSSINPQHRASHKRNSSICRMNKWQNIIFWIRPLCCHYPKSLFFPLQHLRQYPQRNRVEIIGKGRNGAQSSSTYVAKGLVRKARPSHSCHSGLRPGTLGQDCVN